jgi:hypothetical protein
LKQPKCHNAWKGWVALLTRLSNRYDFDYFNLFDVLMFLHREGLVHMDPGMIGDSCRNYLNAKCLSRRQWF